MSLTVSIGADVKRSLADEVGAIEDKLQRIAALDHPPKWQAEEQVRLLRRSRWLHELMESESGDNALRAQYNDESDFYPTEMV